MTIVPILIILIYVIQHDHKFSLFAVRDLTGHSGHFVTDEIIIISLVCTWYSNVCCMLHYAFKKSLHLKAHDFKTSIPLNNRKVSFRMTAIVEYKVVLKIQYTQSLYRTDFTTYVKSSLYHS